MPSITQLIATAEITIAGVPIPRFDSVYLNQPFESHHTFEISLSPDMLPDRAPIVLLDKLADEFVGEEITIKFIQGESILGMIKGSQGQMFRGIVTAVRISKTQASTTTITISGSSPTILLCAGPTTRSFSEMTIGDIVSKLTDEVSLTSKVGPRQSWTYPYTAQYDEDAFTYLQRNAGMWGEWMYYDGETFVFGPKPTADPVDLQLGVNLYDMDYSLRVTPLNGKWLMHHYEENRPYEARSSSINGLQSYAEKVANKSKKLYSDVPEQHIAGVHTNSRLADLAKQDTAKRASELAVLIGRTPEMELQIGGTIKVKEGIFSAIDPRIGAVMQDTTDFGRFVITRLTHYVDGRGVYQATFEAVPVDGDNAPVRYTVPPYQLASDMAKVTDVDDPLSLGRVKVQFSWQSSDMSDWLMTAHPMSGKERGVYFVPEVDDIVWVTYPSGLPDYPFVAGGVYSKTDPPGPLFDKENNIKGIITRSGNHIIINDESGKESIKIYNKDQKNSLELSLDGTHITIKSEGNINIEARDTITMKAKKIDMTADEEWKVKAGKSEIKTDQGMEISAGTDVKVKGKAGVKVEGATVALEAQAQASVKANGQLALESSGQASLKGAIVMIN